MTIKRIITQAGLIVSINAAVAIIPVANAEPYSPYPGTLAAKLVTIRSASTIDVSAQTWPGYTRTFSISLSGIEVPQSNSDAKLCQRELAEQALEFVKEYLSNAEKIEIHDMTMQTSADQNVEADIYTEKGSLTKALKSKGLARPIDTENKEPWC